MATDHIHRKINVSLTHWPTLLLMVGYPLFWLELFFKLDLRLCGTLAWGALLLVGVILVLRQRPQVLELILSCRQALGGNVDRILFLLIGGLSFIILLVSAYAAWLPIHLLQEFDALHYHYTLALQHLVSGSFAHLSWAADDLFLLPLQFALSPFWYATHFPNKWPQFIFLAGLLMVLVSLMRRMAPARNTAWVLVLAAVLGSHGFGIQMGTAMLDLAAAYLFLAAVDSFLRRDMLFFITEASFFIWSKSFMPAQVLLMAVILAGMAFMLRHRPFTFSYHINPQDRAFIRKSILWFCLAGALVAGPFIAKSLYYAGTPLFPFKPGCLISHPAIDFNTPHGQSLLEASRIWMEKIRDGYGYGRGPVAFIKHFWLIAVPDEGVNNRFDYPLGLPFLLFLGPFLYFFIKGLLKKEVDLMSWFVVLWWALWWLCGSQQSRFLYVPVLLMFAVVALRLPKIPRTLMIALSAALFFNVISLVRAHQGDWGKPFEAVIRPQDKQMALDSLSYIREKRSDVIEVENHDVPYARFPVQVTKEKLPHTIVF